MRRAAKHSTTTTTLIEIQIATPMTTHVGTALICSNRHGARKCGPRNRDYWPRPAITYGTVRSRILTSVHSDQLAT
jgi:hypothetical protein